MYDRRRIRGRNRVRRYMAMARQRRDTTRIGHNIALPLAGFIAIVCVQLAILSANGNLSLGAAAPQIWLTLCFSGMIAVFMSLNQR